MAASPLSLPLLAHPPTSKAICSERAEEMSEEEHIETSRATVREQRKHEWEQDVANQLERLEQRMGDVTRTPLRMTRRGVALVALLVVCGAVFFTPLLLFVVGTMWPSSDVCVGPSKLCVAGALGWFAFVCLPAGVFALASALGFATLARARRRERVFNETKAIARKLLADVDASIALERKRLAQHEAGDVARVCALPNEQRTNARQRLPTWWLLTSPVRLVLFHWGGLAVGLTVVFLAAFLVLSNPWVNGSSLELLVVVAGLSVTIPGGLLALPDALLLLARGDPLGLMFRVAVQWWVRGLVDFYRAKSARVSPTLDGALTALAHSTEGVGFVATGLKKQARAVVKVRDDYLAPSLLDAWKLRYLTAEVLLLRPVGVVLHALPSRSHHNPVLSAGVVLVLAVVLVVLGLALLLCNIVVALAVRPLLLFHCVGGQAARVVDMARGSLVCDSAHHMLAVHELIMNGKLCASSSNNDDGNKAVEFEVVRFKNGWAD